MERRGKHVLKVSAWWLDIERILNEGLKLGVTNANAPRGHRGHQNE